MKPLSFVIIFILSPLSSAIGVLDVPPPKSNMIYTSLGLARSIYWCIRAYEAGFGLRSALRTRNAATESCLLERISHSSRKPDRLGNNDDENFCFEIWKSSRNLCPYTVQGQNCYLFRSKQKSAAKKTRGQMDARRVQVWYPLIHTIQMFSLLRIFICSW